MGTIDEILLGAVPSAALYSDPQEFKEANKIFEDEQIGKEFSGTVYYQEWMLPKFIAAYQMALNSEQSYLGSDDKKKLDLAFKRQLAKYALDFLKGLVEDAQTFPRPTFKPEQQ